MEMQIKKSADIIEFEISKANKVSLFLLIKLKRKEKLRMH
jgi:hypothetical protein